MSQVATIPSLTDPIERKIPLDCQPILERQAADLWSHAAEVANELYESIQQACESEGISALVLKSEPFVYPVWIKFECWIPKDERALTERTSWIVTITPKPFHRYQLEYQLEINNKGHVTKYSDLVRFTRQDAVQLVRYLLCRSQKPSLGSAQRRKHWFQVWRPLNKINVFRVYWGGLLSLALMLLGVLIMVIGAGTDLTAIGFSLIVIAVCLVYSFNKRELLVRCPGKPEAEPRHLIRVDSWQAVISGLGEDSQLLRERFLRSLDPPFTKGFRHGLEHIWYWGLDGKVEREQLVLTLGRAIVFCQIHGYDKELYASWDGYLNAGQWVEQNVGKGIDKQCGRLTSINSVVPGYQRLTEYDVTDLNCLIEWTHTRLTKLIRELMEERKIDQEVDFKIQRGERQNLVKQDDRDGGRKRSLADKARAFSEELRRTG